MSEFDDKVDQAVKQCGKQIETGVDFACKEVGAQAMMFACVPLFLTVMFFFDEMQIALGLLLGLAYAVLAVTFALIHRDEMEIEDLNQPRKEE